MQVSRLSGFASALVLTAIQWAVFFNPTVYA
jgi:hypothetical protein